MSENLTPQCPECEDLEAGTLDLDRRDFIRVAGQGAALVALGSLTAVPARAADGKPTEPTPAIRTAKPAEDLVRELYTGLSDDQKKNIVRPFTDAARLRMYNGPLGKRIADVYTKPQQELVARILRAIASDEEGFKKLTRNGTYDTGGGLQGCGSNIFGDPNGKEWAWVFTGHHLTVRCDGRPDDGIGFGGPMYYGHSPNGYSERNCFFYQTKSVVSVYDALSDTQQKKAVVTGTPGENLPSIRFRKQGEAFPGLAFSELTQDQKTLVEAVMRNVLSPYRKEDADEVMSILKTNGGLEKLSLAFYQDRRMGDDKKWHFWRLEGPGFVWNFRVLPHVHTYVNISSKV